VSHDRYFVDKIANKLFIFKGGGRIEESYQSYSDYLAIEEELKELEGLERESKKPKERRRKPKERLSYKEERRLEELPGLIESLEERIAQINDCLADPACYEKRGIGTLSQELAELESEHERLMEEYIELEEKKERIERENQTQSISHR
jgi:ATP-binding cassette subfamily F protein uup